MNTILLIVPRTRVSDYVHVNLPSPREDRRNRQPFYQGLKKYAKP